MDELHARKALEAIQAARATRLDRIESDAEAVRSAAVQEKAKQENRARLLIIQSELTAAVAANAAAQIAKHKEEIEFNAEVMKV